MNPLPLHTPGLNQAVARYFLDQGAEAALHRTWQASTQSAELLTGDSAAWALVVFFLITLTVIFCSFVAVTSRAAPPGPEHELIEEVLRREDELAGSTPPARNPWEKPADWWKQGGA